MGSFRLLAVKIKKELGIFTGDEIAKTMLLKMFLRENVTADIIDVIIKTTITVTLSK